MKKLPEEVVSHFVHACHRVAEEGLVRCGSGNLSMRLDDSRMMVTASGSWMSRLVPDQVSLCSISDGSLLEGPRPSMEVRFHAAILMARSDVNVVLHFQAPCATALACQPSQDINYYVIPEIPFYVGPVARIPYKLPGSEDLAQAVTGAMRGHDMVVMANHGQVTVARDLDRAIQNAVFLELASDMILRSGNRLEPLPEPEVKALLRLRGAPSGGV